MSYAQRAEIDSLEQVLTTYEEQDTLKVKILNRLSFLYNRVDSKKGIAYGEEAMPLAVSLDFTEGIAQSYNSLATNYWNNGELKVAEEYYKKSLVLKEQLGDRKGAGITLINLGVVYQDQHKYSQALSINNQALLIMREVGFKAGIASTLNNMGIVNKLMGDYPAALNYYLEALKVSESINSRNGISNHLNNVGQIYLKMKEYDMALDYFQRALKISKEVGNKRGEAISTYTIGKAYSSMDSVGLAIQYFEKAIKINNELNRKKSVVESLKHLGNLYRDNGMYKKAQEHYNKALAICIEIGDKYKQVDVLSVMAILFEKQGKHEESIKFLLDGLKFAQEIESPILVNRTSNTLSQNYKALGDFENAYKYQSLAIVSKDSLFNEKKLKEFVRLESEFEAEKEKQLLIAKQEKEELSLKNELKRRQVFQYASMVVTILFLLLFFNFYISFRRKKRDNALIQRQHLEISQTAEKLEKLNYNLKELSDFKEGLTHMIAHDMKNSLNVVLGLSAIDPSDKKMLKIGQAGKLMLNLVTNMLDVQKFEESNVSLHLERHSLKHLIAEARAQIELLLQMKSLNLEINVTNQIYFKVDEGMMVRVLVNLLSNAIKYSAVGDTIKVGASTSVDDDENAYLQLSVKDEGFGISKEKLPHIFNKFWQMNAKPSGHSASTGLGLTFCKFAVEAHNGKIEAESEKGLGTTIHITLPIELDFLEIAKETEERSLSDDVVNLILEKDKEIISNYVNELKGFEVFQVGQLHAIFERLEKEDITSKWKEDIRAAVYQGDEKKFKRLLEI
ncbi:tetratricopeptide repeat-containing sensor histidine kinase [Xanthovirga aplysinae]|uniref:tetratricopeptide repeat-containing sensor histidine kinase n=1 Tax=Xanthovirga aplysinae TaxID=2529853 RepID=UPI0016575437|nr:tetratricopeptide repeat-containing sensor histidine kinase [Xanthovirga aplysinae]